MRGILAGISFRLGFPLVKSLLTIFSAVASFLGCSCAPHEEACKPAMEFVKIKLKKSLQLVYRDVKNAVKVIKQTLEQMSLEFAKCSPPGCKTAADKYDAV